jgi:hypothetical protein
MLECDWAGGYGFEPVVEVGGPATLAQSIAAVRVCGHIFLIGVYWTRWRPDCAM